jgi:hyperosmotically inducible protein
MEETGMRVLRILTAAIVAVSGASQIVACASSTESRAAGQVFDDGLITVKVKRMLFHQEGVRLMDVDVATHGGVVQLSGFVPSEEAARLAEQAARRVDGVKEVKNDLRVSQPAR